MPAVVFLSYALADSDIATQVEKRLEQRGHSFRIPVGTPPAGRWRNKLLKALQTSDAVVPFLGEHGLRSNFVSSEIGSAEILEQTGRMQLLPVVVGEFHVPSFVADFHCFRLPEPTAAAFDRLADQLHNAIEEHILDSERLPRVFISHRHRDAEIATKLVQLLESAFYLRTEDIRCTSVQPYTLSAGDQTSHRLRAELASAEVVLGLLAPDTSESKYVLAELGAAWGLDVPTFPLLVGGATHKDVPSPLNERVSISLSITTDCQQLIENVRQIVSLKSRENASARIAHQAEALAHASRDAASHSKDP